MSAAEVFAWPSGAVLWELFLHCMGLSLLAIGGAVATAPDLRRFVVTEQAWISSAEFTSGMALAQAAPGPNLLFVAVIGFQVAGLAGALAALFGMGLPSTLLTLSVTRWGAKRRDQLGVRAFVAGMAPVTLGLILATGLLLAQPIVEPGAGQTWFSALALLRLAALVALVLVAWRTKVSPMWLIGAGALAGIFGWV